MNLLQKLARRIILGKGSEQPTGASGITNENRPSEPHHSLERNLSMNEQQLRQSFSQCSDVVFRKIPLPNSQEILIVFIDGLVDTKMIDESILDPIILGSSKEGDAASDPEQLILTQRIPSANMKKVVSFTEVEKGLLSGNAAILMDKMPSALMIDMKGGSGRSIEEPTSEGSIRGPREGFTETLRQNTAMVRRKIKSPKLKMESMVIGEYTQTDIVISYIEGIAKETVLQEVRSRLKDIQIDAILESGYIEEFIQDAPYSPFSTVQNTERPDTVAASLLEGRVAIFTDGTPFVLIVPFTFWAGVQAAEDFYNPYLYATATRIIRILFLLASLFLPSVFIAIVNFHPQMLPTSLALSFTQAREASPFPMVIEAFIMEGVFEGLREAGIRLPKAIGSAVSIVGALVIGQAAVQAGIISAPIVIVVAGTGIASFTAPRYNVGYAFRMLRFPLLLCAGVFGLYGITIGTLAMLLHMVSLRSFGVPYMSPLAPVASVNMQDMIWRNPHWAMNKRPNLIGSRNPIRTPKGQKPKP
ncbi:spore germination protein [Paenibacillus urinalis]|uniref:Spore germination protein n=1 Tax=Paenibacillus urinalis TaxID=521520 RepID=A0AAX3N0A1_9BACL|nr:MULTISPECIES: spore germination protein [Paenibacillus]WDH82079.1 spore germination protein [Paenibacillus urinalis]WDH98134.1 spore germination protein [Paenibacillus urinalis]WDI01817.1 spore germination protein [Paenibacillus urinalis]GAK42653.1 hypothetical protein TCA2_5145 [Paenibacillus sp. TCA20]